jgi:hypothetical protein
MSSNLLRLPIELASRLADDLDAERRDHWVTEADVGDEFVRICEWSEALRDDLREHQHVTILDDEEWWQWVMGELSKLAAQAADWTFYAWAADLVDVIARMMRKAVGLGWRVELQPDVWMTRAGS